MEDFRAAIRFVRKFADKFRFDPDKVIAIGSSAGAATALFLAYAKKA